MKNIEKLTKEFLEKRLEKGRLYYHCCECGFIFNDKDYNVGILNTRRFGIIGLTKLFEDYEITSGYCNHCYERRMKDLKERTSKVNLKQVENNFMLK